jgi:hypothetical protein
MDSDRTGRKIGKDDASAGATMNLKVLCKLAAVTDLELEPISKYHAKTRKLPPSGTRKSVRPAEDVPKTKW